MFSDIIKVRQIATITALGLFFSIALVVRASAHVTIKPGEVAPSSYTVFSVSVPNERDSETVSVTLDIPEGLSAVTPTVKPGWSIVVNTESSDGEGQDHHGSSGVVKSITWSGGSIPMGQRDDFSFSAKTPAGGDNLVWNSQQVYADGMTVTWDRGDDDQPVGPDGSPDFSQFGPHSITRVVSPDITIDSPVANESTSVGDQESSRRALYVSIAAVVVSLISLVIATRPSTQKR